MSLPENTTRTLTDEQVNQYAMFLPYQAAEMNNGAEALPCIVLGGDEDGNDGVQVYAYAENGQVIVSVHYDTAGPDEDGHGPWAYYGPDRNLVPTVVKAGDDDPVWQAAAEVNPDAETLAQAVYAAYIRGWKDRGVFRVPGITAAELADVARQRTGPERPAATPGEASQADRYLAQYGRHVSDEEDQRTLTKFSDPDDAGITDRGADVSTDTGDPPDMTLILHRLDQAERRLVSRHPKAAKDPELAAMLRSLRDEATALNGDARNTEQES